MCSDVLCVLCFNRCRAHASNCGCIAQPQTLPTGTTIAAPVCATGSMQWRSLAHTWFQATIAQPKHVWYLLHTFCTTTLQTVIGPMLEYKGDSATQQTGPQPNSRSCFELEENADASRSGLMCIIQLDNWQLPMNIRPWTSACYSLLSSTSTSVLTAKWSCSWNLPASLGPDPGCLETTPWWILYCPDCMSST